VRRRRRDPFPANRGRQAVTLLVLLLDVALTAALVAALVYVALFVPNGWSIVVILVPVAAVGGLVRSRTTRRRRRRKGRAARKADAARLRRVLQPLCLVGDLAVPAVDVQRDPVAQSWTVAVPWGEPRIFVTTALLDALDDRALAAVAAHELSHIAHRDAIVMTLAAAPGLWVMRGTRLAFERLRRDDPDGAWVTVPVGVVLMAFAAPWALLARILSRGREMAADADAARLVGSPAAVAAALRRLDAAVHERPHEDLRAVAARDVLHILPTRDAQGIARLWATHPRLERRVAALERMETALQAGGGD
jgi:heat shock protein HtpX